MNKEKEIKSILVMSVVTTAIALAWIFIRYSNVLNNMYYHNATIGYILFNNCIIFAMISAILFLWHLLGIENRKDIKNNE